MSTTFIASCIGFFIALILLFYFIAKYRQAEVKDDNDSLDLPEDLQKEAPSAAPDALRIFGKSQAGGQQVSAKEISDIKDKLKDLHYRIEEIKILAEKRNAEASKAVAGIEQRVSTFENEYVNKLQPTLYSLINELENIQNKSKN